MVRQLRPAAGFAFAIVAIFTLLSGCGPDVTPPSGPPNVLLITVDTLRPDALGWVSGKNDTPNIDRLADGGFAFAGAVTVAPLTAPSHVSIHTGTYPLRHGVRINGQFFGADQAPLAERLGALGYRTAAFVSGFPVDSEFGLDRGFDQYDDEFDVGVDWSLQRTAGNTTHAALNWIEQNEEPWFVWVHYFDPHDPYEPPAPFAGSDTNENYRGEVRYVDQQIGVLRDGIERTESGPLFSVFVGDHGEALGEHGEPTHSVFLYDSTTLVPMIFHYPGAIAPGSSTLPVRVVDLLPTIVARLDAEATAGRIDGVDLSPTLRGELQQLDPAYLESDYPLDAYGWSPLRAMRTERWKYIRLPREELYDLAADPQESTNVIEANTNVANELRGKLMELESAAAQVVSESAIDERTLEKLQSLGYVGAQPTAPQPYYDLPDPKDRIASLPSLMEIEVHFGAGTHAAALPLIDRILADDPDDGYAVWRKGAALVALERFAAAIPYLERAVAQNPDGANQHFELADALGRMERYDESIAHWQEGLRVRPRRIKAWSNLGLIFGANDQPDEAVQALREAAELDSTDPVILENLAFAYVRANKSPAAADTLLRAAAIVGERQFRHPGFLGLALAESGRQQEALVWLPRARTDERSYPRARAELARLLGRIGRPTEAVAILQQLERQVPSVASAIEADAELRALLER